MVDNFLDISHFPWVHTGTFGSSQATGVASIELVDLDGDFHGYAYEVDASNPEEAAASAPPPTGHLLIADQVAVAYPLRDWCFLCILCMAHAGVIWPGKVPIPV